MLGDESTCVLVKPKCQQTEAQHVRGQIHMCRDELTKSGDRDLPC